MQLSARFALTTDFVITFGARFLSEVGHVGDRVFNHQKYVAEHARLLEELQARLATAGHAGHMAW